MGKAIYRTFLGFLGAYIAYIPVTFVVEYALYGRIDSEREFYALYYAVGAPFMLERSYWNYVQQDEFILNIAGVALIAIGVIIANNRRLRARLFNWLERVPHP
jgi:hypothetical protein